MIERSDYYDVIIAGGGIVGLALANALKSSGLSIAIVEQHPAAPLTDAIDLRVSAINPASLALFVRSGVPLESFARLCAFHEMHVWDSTGAGQIHFDAAESGLDSLGVIIENSVIQQALLSAAQAAENISWLCPQRIESVLWQDEAHVLLLTSGERLQAKLLVAADGADSRLRELAGIDYQRSSYQQQGIVCTVDTELAHQHTAWQCFLPTGPLAFLPLASGQCSIVWSLDEDYADELLALDDEAFSRRLERAFDYRLGAVTALSARRAFPLTHGHVDTYVKPGLALIGDAAHTIHPLAGQGANLGISDAAELAAVISEAKRAGRQWWALHTLRKYERARKGDNRLMENAMSIFKQLFGNQNPWLASLRNTGLTMANQLPLLKAWFMKHAMGTQQR
jgi:2-octaprenylphenol hydroxylase